MFKVLEKSITLTLQPFPAPFSKYTLQSTPQPDLYYFLLCSFALTSPKYPHFIVLFVISGTMQMPLFIWQSDFLLLHVSIYFYFGGCDCCLSAPDNLSSSLNSSEINVLISMLGVELYCLGLNTKCTVY